MIKNVQEFIYKRLRFFKNITQDFGAQQMAIDEKKDYENIIVRWRDKGKSWGLCSEKDILRLLEKNISLFEMLHDFPYKVYFDIDGDKNCRLEEIKNIINKNFTNAKMSISGYETEEKNSYHIILNNYIINNVEERDKLKIIVKHFKTLNSNFDDRVYSSNRQMKAVNQGKPNKPIQNIIEDDNIKNHLITFFINNDSYDINNILVDEVETKIIHKKISNGMDWSQIPQLKLSLPGDIDINNNLDLLKITPFNKEFNHLYTYRTAVFCYYNDISLEDFLSWYKNKSCDNIDINKWATYHWPRMKNCEFSISRDSYIKMLSNFYDELKDNKYSKFNQLFIYDKPTTFINSLSQDDFIFNKKCKIINIGMGGGKTTQTINYLKSLENHIDEFDDTESFIWITPNISLAKNTFTRIKDNNINCNIYDSAKNKKEKQFLIENSKNIIICLNSLFYTNKNQYNSYEVVVIDEIETFLKLFNNNKTLIQTEENKQLDTVWKKFVEILLHCKQLILLDAFVSKITLNFLDNLGIEYEIIKRKNEKSDRKAILKKDFKYWFNDIIKDLKHNKKLIIFYPFKNGSKRKNNSYPSMQDLSETIEKYTGKKGIFHNADSGDKSNDKLKDVNKYWVDYDFVVSNNKINVGLNFDVEYFDTCYVSLAGFSSLRDAIQFSYRARTLKSNTIKYCYLDHYNNKTCEKIQNVNEYNDIFLKLNEDIVIETMADLKTTWHFFLHKARYEIQNDNILDELEPIEFIENDYYDYNKIQDYEKDVIKDFEKDIYAQEASTIRKFEVKKFYFKNLFNSDTPDSVICDLWNNNKFNLINSTLNILYKDNIINLLKDKYNWTCCYPDHIDKKFKFESQDLEMIFNNYKFKDLTLKSKHHLILKTFINTAYGYNAIKSQVDKNKNYKFYIDEKFKDYYVMISENITPLKIEELEIID